MAASIRRASRPAWRRRRRRGETRTAPSAAAAIAIATASNAATSTREERGRGSSPKRDADLVDQGPTRRLALRRVFRHRAGEDVVERVGQGAAPFARSRRRRLEVGVDHGHVGDPRERDRPRERLEQHAAEPVDVGAPVDIVAANLLRRDVVDGADEMTVGRPTVGDALRQPEVGEVDVLAAVLAVEEDVRRLHVAVDEPASMRRVQGVGDLARDRDRARRLERALAPEERLEVRALDEAHRDEQAIVGLAGLVDRHHVRMVERRRDPRLAQEALAKARVLRVALGEELERHAALEPRIEGAVDLPRPPAPDELLDLVPGDHVTGRDVPSDRHRSTPAARESLHHHVPGRNGRAVVGPAARPPATRASGARGSRCTLSPGRLASGSRRSRRRSRPSLA